MGDNNPHQEAIVVLQGVFIALVLSAVILINQNHLFSYFVSLLSTDVDLSESIQAAQTYFSIRVWSAPVSLINLVLT
ncbi:hypothetical protein, partial [Marinovum sp. 1_MG-2023]|uniref:hypothetical protein n=1 Tax=Marinovum sp. 1_MG-2023 TaxID=3062633 RepID=UPI0026E27DDA